MLEPDVKPTKVIAPVATRDAVVSLLNDPASYPHPCDEVARIQTHISDVFLTGEFAYKIKRPVNYGFLDFSSLEQRRYFCEHEVELNRRYAPEMYLGVVAITLNDGKLCLGGSGTPVEYAVKMRQFDNTKLLSNLLGRGELDSETIKELSVNIAEFHARAEQTPEHWHIATVRRLIQDNFQALRGFCSSAQEVSWLNPLIAQTEALLDQHSGLIEQRTATHVRSLHGDLHLRNIVLIDGRPTLFDGLEFNPEYSCTDTWADIGFLIMDLRARDRRDLATVALNSYLEETDDFGGLALLPLYMSYRAAVRAKVAGLRAGSEGRSPGSSAEMEQYLVLANQVLFSAPEFVAAIGGLSGCGKTSTARELAGQLGAIHIRTDVVRKHLLGLRPTESAPPESYTRELSAKVFQAVFARAKQTVAAGFSVVIDGVFGSERERAAAAEVAANLELPFRGIWLEVDPAVARERIGRRRKAGPDASDADEAVLDLQLARPIEGLTWARVDASAAVDAVADECLNQFFKHPPSPHSLPS